MNFLCDWNLCLPRTSPLEAPVIRTFSQNVRRHLARACTDVPWTNISREDVDQENVDLASRFFHSKVATDKATSSDRRRGPSLKERQTGRDVTAGGEGPFDPDDDSSSSSPSDIEETSARKNKSKRREVLFNFQVVPDLLSRCRP